MATDDIVTLSKNGTHQRILPISQVRIPDVWHIAEALRKNGKVAEGPGCADLILECWHIAHSLKRQIEEG